MEYDEGCHTDEHEELSLQFLVIMLYLAFYRISDPCDDACYINGNVLGKRSSPVEVSQISG